MRGVLAGGIVRVTPEMEAYARNRLGLESFTIHPPITQFPQLRLKGELNRYGDLVLVTVLQ